MTHTVEGIDDGVLLRQRVGDFSRAVSAIAERRPEWHNGVGRWSASVYDRVRGSVLGRSAPAGRIPAGSRCPGRLGHLDWLVSVDGEVAEWSQLPGTTAARLIEMRSRSWRVEDGPLLVFYTEAIGRWVAQAATLLDEGELHVYLRGRRCPGCATTHAYVGRDGERRRVPALLATNAGITCQHCAIRFPPERWGLLAEMLA